MQSPWILVKNQDVTKLELPFKHEFLWELQLSLYHIFYSSVGIVFQFYRYFLTHVNYIFFDVSYALPSVKFKHSYYVVAVDNYFFRWGLSVYYAFHDQPEEDSGPFVYYCLNRDNAKMRFSYLPQSFDTYVENVMPGFFSLDQFCNSY